MKDWQKAHLLISYEHLQYAPCPEDIVDDLIESQVIELVHIKTVENLSNYGWLIKHVLETHKEACYINLLKIIKQHTEPDVCSKIENIAVECEKGKTHLFT